MLVAIFSLRMTGTRAKVLILTSDATKESRMLAHDPTRKLLRKWRVEVVSVPDVSFCEGTEVPIIFQHSATKL